MTQDGAVTPEQLMQQALAGDKAAYSEVLQVIQRMLKPMMLRKLPNSAAADDVIQEVLIAVHKARHTYDGMRPLLPWVMAIARYKFADYMRQHYAQRHVNLLEPEEIANIAAENVTEGVGFSESLKREIRSLNEKQQKILHFMYVEGYTAKEVAERIQMSESAVKVAAHRAYKSLRKRIGDI